jgi:hypothetical protein
MERVCRNCGKKHYAKGLCVRCYNLERRERLLKSGSEPKNPDKASLKAARKKCAAWRCDNEVYGMGVCEKHYHEWGMEAIRLSGEKTRA